MHEQRFTFKEKGIGPNDKKGGKKSTKENKKKRSGQGWNKNIIFSYNNQGSIDDMIKG